jgi:uncharacterized protein YndB with AHSA1/START domain
MPKTNLRQQIIIDALPSKVWKVLTTPDYISQYLFEGEVQCNWTEGSSLMLVTQNNNQTETIHKGNILQAVPGVVLKYKLKEEHSSSFVNTTYELIPAEDGVELKLYTEGFEDSDEEYLIRMQQMKLLLQKIKWLAEYS